MYCPNLHPIIACRRCLPGDAGVRQRQFYLFGQTVGRVGQTDLGNDQDRQFPEGCEGDHRKGQQCGPAIRGRQGNQRQQYRSGGYGT